MCGISNLVNVKILKLYSKLLKKLRNLETGLFVDKRLVEARDQTHAATNYFHSVAWKNVGLCNFEIDNRPNLSPGLQTFSNYESRSEWLSLQHCFEYVGLLSCNILRYRVGLFWLLLAVKPSCRLSGICCFIGSNGRNNTLMICLDILSSETDTACYQGCRDQF